MDYRTPSLSAPEGPAGLVEDAGREADAGAAGGRDHRQDPQHQQDPEGWGGPALARGVIDNALQGISKTPLAPLALAESVSEGVS